MRDILAALLRARGYTHDDETDRRDLHWYSPELGVRPLLVCVAHEMNRDLAATVDHQPVALYDTYSVSTSYVAQPALVGAEAS